jgi:catechol 2,3-dioxygenase-like lactoylglutathione lyase family enzyme
LPDATGVDTVAPVRFRVEGLDHVAIAVGDQEISEEWYTNILGLEREHADVWGDIPVALMAPGSGLALFSSESASSATPGLRHIAFRVDRENFEAAQEELRRSGIEFEFQDHVVAHSIYFQDPDGLQLELTTYDVGQAQSDP